MAKKKNKNTKTRRQVLTERRNAAEKNKRLARNAFILIILILGGFGFYNLSNTPDAIEVSEERLQDNPTVGNPQAPVTLTEFGDFGCPSCQDWHNQGIFTRIMEQFDGQLKMEWRDLPIIFPPYSISAAEAGQCAYDQGKFWEFHDILYNNWNGENNGWAAREKIIGFANDAKLDVDKFTECLDEKHHQPKIDASNSDARKLGLTGTPAFFIISNNQVIPIQGAQPFEVFQRIFDAELQN